MIDLNSMSAEELERLRSILAVMKPGAPLDAVDWEAIADATRQHHESAKLHGTVAGVLAQIDRTRAGRAAAQELERRLDAMATNMAAAPLPPVAQMSIAEKIAVLDDKRLSRRDRRRATADVEAYFAKRGTTNGTLPPPNR